VSPSPSCQIEDWVPEGEMAIEDMFGHINIDDMCGDIDIDHWHGDIEGEDI